MTINRVVYAGTAGNLVNSANFTFNGTTATLANDASISGLTVGKGGGASNLNTAVGLSALSVNTGTDNTGIGSGGLGQNTTGSANTAVGRVALYGNTTGSYNTGVGNGAGQGNTTGSNNSSYGYQALFNNTTASNNTAVGYQAGYTNQTGSGNTLVGYQAGFNTNTNGANTFVGKEAGYSVTTGYYNTFIGNGASGGSGTAVTTGIKNTIIGGYTGNQGGLDIRTASNYIVLSDGDGNPRGVFDNNGNFLVNSTTSNSNTFKFKVQAATDVCVGLASATSITGALTFNFINDGNSANVPVDFRCNGFYISNGLATGAGTNTVKFNTSTKQLTYDTSSARYKDNIRNSQYGLTDVLKLRSTQFEYKDTGRSDVGLVAEEVYPIIPELVGITEDGLPDSVSYDRMVSVLVKAIQELNLKVEALEAQLNK